jgi:hypothetical protein
MVKFAGKASASSKIAISPPSAAEPVNAGKILMEETCMRTPPEARFLRSVSQCSVAVDDVGVGVVVRDL